MPEFEVSWYNDSSRIFSYLVRLGLVSNKYDNGVVLAFGSVEVVLILLYG